MRVLLILMLGMASLPASLNNFDNKEKYINNMAVLNGHEDSDISKIEIRGNGESCLIDFVSDGEIYDSTCSSLTNSKNEKIYCTSSKIICKTYDEIYAFVFESPTTMINNDVSINHQIQTSEGKVDNLETHILSKKTEQWKIFLLLYFIMMIITIFKGYGDNRTIIVFRDYNDLGLTFLIPASVFIIFLLFSSFGGDPKVGMPIGVIIALILFVILIKNTYIDNNKSTLYTFMSIMTKVPLGLIWILNFIMMLNPGGKTAAQRRKNRGISLVVLGILTPVIGMLVVNKEGSLFNPKDWIKGKRVGTIRNHL